MKKYILPIIFILCITGLVAFSITDYAFGYKIPSNNTRSTAMGGTGVARGYRPMDAFINPAVLGNMNQGYWAELNVHGSQFMDKRSFPYYDSFEGYVDEATYATNFNYNAKFNGAIAWIYDFNPSKFAISARYASVYDFTGFYEEQVRNNNNSNNNGYPERIADNLIDNEGTLDGFSVDLAYALNLDNPIITNAGLGFEFTSLMGDINQNTTVNWSKWAIEQAVAQGDTLLLNYYYKNQRDLSGFQMKAGFNADLGERISFGVAYSPKTEIDVTSNVQKYFIETISGDNNIYETFAVDPDQSDSLTFENYDLPSSLRFGFTYRPRNIMRTVMNAEAEYVTWSDINEIYEDAWNYYIGIEHSLSNALPVRIGFSSETSYQTLFDGDGKYARKLTMPSITTGTGYEITSGLNLDFALSYSFREYESLDLFSDSYYYAGHTYLWPNTHINIQDRDWSNPDKVKEAYLKANLSFTYKY